MSIDQLTHLLALVGALTNETTVAAEKVLLKELVKGLGCLDLYLILVVDPADDLFAQKQRVSKSALNRAQPAQHHLEKSEQCVAASEL